MRPQNFLQYGLALGMAIASAGMRSLPVNAQMTQQELNPNGVVLVASPYQNGEQHQLLIVEQLTRARACWSEQKTNTAVTLINPLLSEFDFSGICGRATDSNGFSVRMGGQDLNWRYALQVVEKDEQLLLMARSTNPKKTSPDFLIGRVGGVTPDFAKINLEPGWRVSRRVANGKLTGHFYLTFDRSLEQLVAAMQQSSTAPLVPMSSAVPTTAIPPVSGPIAVPEAMPAVMPEAVPTVMPVVPPAPPTR
jgi:Protein of unknown function (DUF3747)